MAKFDTLISMDTQTWPSRTIFILAAIGSAAGLGNLWRFPYLAYEWGGGAFIVAIIVANLLIGVPLLMLEIGLGQKTRHAAPRAFSLINQKFRYIGWFAVLTSFLIATYYMVVVAWGINFFAGSFTLSWGDDPEQYFFTTLLHAGDTPGMLGTLSAPVVIALLIAWTLIYFTVWKGVRSVSAVVKYSATLPFVILLILAIRALTLPGAGDGVALFLVPEWSSLLSPELWLAACSQVFFSLSLAVGVMVVYGAYNGTRMEIANSTLWIALGNFLVSFLSGLVVFGTLGFMAFEKGVAFTEVVAGGPSLVFIVFPQVLNALPAFSAVFASLFFLTLLLLAVDSAFSLIESASKAVSDILPKVKTEILALFIVVVGGVCSLVYATEGGVYVLDSIDHFVVTYALVAIGLFEAIMVGWLWKGGGFVRYLDDHSGIDVRLWWGISIRFIIPFVLSILLVWNLIHEFRAPYGEYPVSVLLIFACVPLVVVPLLAYLLGILFAPRR